MSIRRILSGGQAGVEQAALDAAIQLEVDHGGWIPKGRRTEDSPAVPERYALVEMESTGYTNYAQCRERNVLDADGTLVICHGKPSGESAMSCRLAEKHARPAYHLDLSRKPPGEAIREIHAWALANDICTLNVVGTRASKDHEIYVPAFAVVEGILLLSLVVSREEKPVQEEMDLPETVDEAVQRLVEFLPLKEKTTIANMTAAELPKLENTVGKYIVNQFELADQDSPLAKSCRFTAGKTVLTESEAARVILQELAYRLHRTHRLRVV